MHARECFHVSISLVNNLMRSFVEERRNIVYSSSTRAFAAYFTGAQRDRQMIQTTHVQYSVNRCYVQYEVRGPPPLSYQVYE